MFIDKVLVAIQFLFKQVDPDLCSPKPCSIGPFYQPSIPDDLNMYATGVYYKTVKPFGLLDERESTVSPAQLHMAAHCYM